MTAERMKDEGFLIEVLEMDRDQIKKFRYSNSTTEGIREIHTPSAVHVVGGHVATREYAYGIALIGVRNKEGDIRWVCDGAVLNRRWVLSASHCFIQR